ncbi:MAG: DNA-binding protein Alba [Candidatus Asgardarchaeia archaeon]
MSSDRAILVGKKPIWSYVMAALVQLNQGAKEIIIKARGRAISKAVDIAEIVRQRWLPGRIKVKNIEIGTDTITDPNGNQRNISTIEIVLETTEES